MESAENYLETILILKKGLGEVRAIDIANYLNFSKPSVSAALKSLKASEYITVGKSGYIALTKKGLGLAGSVYERHTLLTGFFVSLGVDPKTAMDDACKIEHYLSEQTIAKIKEHCLVCGMILQNKAPQ